MNAAKVNGAISFRAHSAYLYALQKDRYLKAMMKEKMALVEHVVYYCMVEKGQFKIGVKYTFAERIKIIDGLMEDRQAQIRKAYEND